MFKKSHINLRQTGSVLALGVALTLSFASAAHAQTVSVNIPAENTAQALTEFSRQAHIQILFPYDVASHHLAPAISGQFDRAVVLQRLLDGSGLEIAEQSDTMISLRAAPSRTDKSASSSSTAGQTTEVIVTGSHIRGTNPTSPIHILTQKDIDQSGYADIGDLMRSLPENFSGGQNPGVIAASGSNIGNENASNASSINLRGLGTDATLVLLNGHRLSDDSYFQGADISGIPLGAVDRIDVVPDGASALYGSDAVAGVVNIVLRKNYNGSELTTRIGDATEGAGTESSLSFLSGLSKPDWHVLADLEYAKQDGISAAQRTETEDAPPATTLEQPQTRRSFFLNAGRDLTDQISLSFDGLWSDRNTENLTQYPGSPIVYAAQTYVPAYSVATTLDVALPSDWKLHLTGVASGSRDNFRYVSVGTPSWASFENGVQYVEASADGKVLSLPSGEVKLAVGAGYRDETLYSPDYVEGGRHVSYVFAETSVPLVAHSDTRLGLHDLTLSLSGRAEDYTDFGKTANPRIGLRYVPVTGLAFRGSWGTSFKAPSFLQLYQTSNLYLYPASVLGYSGAAPAPTALLTYGGNPDLKPEKSRSWTLGADYTPQLWPSLKLSATVFGIDYRDRVVQPISPITTGLSNPIFSPFVISTPTSGDINSVFSQGFTFTNYSGASYDPTKVVAILHDQYQNATSQQVNGADFSYRQDFTAGTSSFDAFANLTLLRLMQRTVSTAPDVELSGTIFNPPKTKARAGIEWQTGAISATGIVNYTASEIDTGITPNAKIASNETVDANLSYNFSGVAANARGFKVSLAVINLFDKKPPFAQSPAISYAGIYFDSTNSSVIGRFISLTVSKSW